MHNIKDRDYEQFTAPERINLTVAALARGDLKEADRLWDTCPRHDYKALDFSYTLRVTALTILNMAFREQCLLHYHRIKMIEARILHLECFIDKEVTIARLKKLSDIEDIYIARLKAVYCGMKQFCNEVGLCYDDFMKNVFVESICPDIENYLTNVMPADAEYTTQSKLAFAEYWQT